MNMSGWLSRVSVLLGMGLVVTALGCGQVLDTAPPDPRPDASQGDSGGGSTDAGHVDATVDAAVDATVDAGCSSDEQCANPFVCDGVERCVEGSCVDGEPLVCVDDVDCTVDSCSEEAGGCTFVPDDGVCAAASPDAPEICSPADGGCISAMLCSGDADCPSPSCAGVWACVAGMCSVVVVPTLPPDTVCMTTACSPDDPRADAQGVVVTLDASACDDGVACTVDRCTISGSCAHVDDSSACMDSWACTVDRCAPADPLADGDSGCVNEPDFAACDDGVDCTEEICDPDADGVDARGCVNPPRRGFCSDGAGCTRDFCLPGTLVSGADGCVHKPVDSDCGGGVVAGSCVTLVCAPSASPDPVTGCAGDWRPRLCTGFGGRNSCDTTGACSSSWLPSACESDAWCDDGNPCNGLETCSGAIGFRSCHQATDGCPAPTGSCLLAVCDTSTGTPTCSQRPDPACFTGIVPAGSP